MTVSHISTTLENNSSGLSDTSTVSSIAATTGDYILSIISFRDSAGQTLNAPTWGGQTFTIIGSLINTTEGKVALYGLTAASSATNNVEATFNGFVYYNHSVMVSRDSAVGAFTPSSVSTNLYNSGTYSAPTITKTSVPNGSLLISILSAMGWDTGYSDVTATTWTGNKTSRGTITNTGTKAVNQLNIQTAAGAGADITATWTESANSPMYTHAVLYLEAAAALSVDTITSSIQHGGSGSFTYTGLGTITAMTVDGIAVASVSGTGGSGTFTMPSRVDGATIAGHGSKTVTITGSLGSANTTINIVEAAAQQYVTITSLGTGVGALATYLAIATTDEITSDTPATLGVTTSNIGADTLIHTDYTGTQTLWWWDASTKVVTQIFLINGLPVSSGITRRGITEAITTSRITQ
jgi:hypothetical protein